MTYVLHTLLSPRTVLSDLCRPRPTTSALRALATCSSFLEGQLWLAIRGDQQPRPVLRTWSRVVVAALQDQRFGAPPASVGALWAGTMAVGCSAAAGESAITAPEEHPEEKKVTTLRATSFDSHVRNLLCYSHDDGAAQQTE